MNDPIVVIKSENYKSDIPGYSYEAGEHPELDVISLRQNENDASGISPAMIRIRNRGYKPAKLHNILFTHSSNSAEGHLAIIMPMKYGFSDKETLKNLDYMQKVSKKHNVVDSHNVLEGYRDEFSTFEDMLVEKHKNEGNIGLAR